MTKTNRLRMAIATAALIACAPPARAATPAYTILHTFDATTDGTSCSAAVTGGSVTPHNYFILPPQQNTHFTFPTPLEIPRLEGVSCLGFNVTTNLNGGSVGILLNGFISGK